MVARRLRSRTVVGLAVAALGLSACGVDAGVVSISAAPTPTLTTIPAAEPATDATDETEPVDVTPTTQPQVLETADAPADTLPPIVEPDLFTIIPFSDIVDVDDNREPSEHDEFVAVAFADIEAWWSEVYPEVYGEPFEPLAGGLFAGYPARESDIPGCGEATTSYVDLQAYVAFYCEFDDFMAYDDGRSEVDSLLLPLADQYGSAVMGVVLAHEYGHAIQARIGALDRLLATIVTEQQADCFAGAWTGHAYRGESGLLRLGDRDVRAGLLAMLSVRDPVGTDQFVPGGHGSAFDRVGAFQEGFLEGPARCAELLDEPLDLMPNQFQSQQDFDNEGNAPYDCVVGDETCTPAPDFLADDINNFWKVALGAEFTPITAVPVNDLDAEVCADRTVLDENVIICAGDRTFVFDEPEVVELYNEFGDFTLGYFYGIAWGEFAQRQIDSPLTGEDRALLNDCFTGAWVRDITPDQFGRTGRSGLDEDNDGVPDASAVSSPGDLDEAIQMAILVGDPGANVDVVGSPFEKIAAFRTGVLGGLDACTNLLPG